MLFLRKQLDKVEKHFEKGGRLEKLYPLYDAIDTFLFVPGTKTKNAPHVRDSIDLKRSMIFVVISLLPCLLFGIYNTGYQHNLLSNSNLSILNNIWIGTLTVIPIYIVTYSVGGLCEAVFAIIRRHEINEGFIVTGFLIPLTMPPTVPLWILAIATIFGIVVGKEIFGGTGYNIFNPALTTRAFLFFAYPTHMSGIKPWIYPEASETLVDGVSQATPLLSQSSNLEIPYTWWDMFYGNIPGSIGETSTLAILIGALILLITGIGSWRIMLSTCIGLICTSLLLNQLSVVSDNPMFKLSSLEHFVMGGFAFGMVFMATDPVSGAQTNKGRWMYGLLIGFMATLIRCINPAYPEGVMLAILFANAFAPLFDYSVVQSHIKKRQLSYEE